MAAKRTVKISEVTKLIESIEENKKQAKALYEQVDADSEKLLKMLTHGYELHSEVKGENDVVLYKRVRIIDNARLLSEGKPLYKATGFKRVEIEIDYLKHPPKDKK